MRYRLEKEGTLRRGAEAPVYAESWAFAPDLGYFFVTQSASHQLHRLRMEDLASETFDLSFAPTCIGYLPHTYELIAADAEGILRSCSAKDEKLDWRRLRHERGEAPRFVWRIVPAPSLAGFLALLWEAADHGKDGGYFLLYKTLQAERWIQLDQSPAEDPPTDIAWDPRGWLYLPLGKEGQVEVWGTADGAPTYIWSRRYVKVSGTPLDLSRVHVSPKDGSVWLASYNYLLGLEASGPGDLKEAPFFAEPVTDQTDGINDFALDPSGQAAVAACTYTDRVALVQLDDRRVSYLQVEKPGRVMIVGDRLFVLGHGAENVRLYRCAS